MAKIAHISDIHWRGIQRHKEYTKAFNLLFEELKILKPDLIINTGDTFHTKTQGITPEIIGKLAWMFDGLADIAPTAHILGNHDGNLTNKTRQDIISPIHDAIKNSSSFLYKRSGVYPLDHLGMKIALCVFSVFDISEWHTVKPKEGYINIALYHGSIDGCITDSNWKLTEGEQKLDFFKGYDFAFLGDIHKHQVLQHRRDKDGILKPNIAYPGSLIQQNHGEEIKKGFLVWDIRANNDWDMTWQKLENMAPFVTLNWKGTTQKTLDAFESLHGKYAYMPGTRYRVSSSCAIPSIQTSQLSEVLRVQKPAEITFKTDIATSLDAFDHGNMKITKKSLLSDPDQVIGLYQKYIESNPETFPYFDKKQIETASEIIRGYFSKFRTKNNEFEQIKNTVWTIRSFEFDNLYGFGKGNKIRFGDLNNIVGIFGPNRSGKSSTFGALMYTLFNTTDRGPIKNAYIINEGKGYAFGKCRIGVGNEDYIIERRTEKVMRKDGTINPKSDGKSNTKVELWRVENRDGKEVKVSANGLSRDDTDRLIRKLIGTPDDFLLTAFANQENLNMFISNKATKRKEILNRFLELDVFDKFFAFAKEDYALLNAQSKTYTVRDWARLIERAEKDISKLEKEIADTTDKLKSLGEKRQTISTWLTAHEKEIASVDNDSISGFEKHIVSLEASISQAEATKTTGKKELREIKMAQKVAIRKINKVDATALKENLKEMESLRDTLVILKNSFKVEDATHTQQERSIRKLAQVPCGNKFPECHFIKDSHEAKKAISEQRKTVKALERGIKTSQKLFDRFAKKNLQQTLAEHEKLCFDNKLMEQKQKILEERVATAEKDIPSLKKELRSFKSKLKKIQKLTGDKTTEEYNRKIEQLKKLDEDISTQNETKNAALISLGGKQDGLNKLMSEQDQGKDIIKRLKVYDSIQNAFSKNGIPAMVLQNQLPVINKEVARVLDGLVDFEVTMETDTSANIMDVYLEDTKGRRLIELCSGMEKTICSMALRVALGNLSSLSRPNFLVLDESFGALDDESLQTGLEMLSLLRGYFKTIFVITHVQEIKEIADDIIEIRNNGNESKVEI